MENSNKKFYCEGYAIVFDTQSVNLGGFVEICHRGCITQEMVNNSDVFAKLDHRPEYILARSKNNEGSLKLTVDDKGLKYRFEIPENSKGKQLITHLRRGEINQSSFAFSMEPDPKNEKWEFIDGIAVRHIYHIAGLYDISPVYTPGYEATTCNLIEENIIINNE